MKKLLLAALCLLGMNIMFVSCEKVGGDNVNMNNIEGRWWVPQQKADYVLSGKPVSSFTASNDFEYAEVFCYKAYLENGGCTLTDLQDGYSYTFAYTLIDNDLYVGQGIFQSYKLKIVNATKKDGAADIQYVSEVDNYETIVNDIERNGTTTFDGATFKKKVVDRYNGIDIYGLDMIAFLGISIESSTQVFPPFWYINSKGEKVPCICNNKDWENGFGFWYDAYRFYFIAE